MVFFMMNKKGALGLIIGIVVAVLVIGGVSYFAFSGNSDDDIVNGSSGVGSGSGASGGTSGGSSGGTGSSGSSGSISSWCTSGSSPGKDLVSSGEDVEIIKNKVDGIKTFKGKPACLFEYDIKTTKGIIENDIYTYAPGDAWVVTSPGGGGSVEYHWVDGVCTEAMFNGASIPCPPVGVG